MHKSSFRFRKEIIDSDYLYLFDEHMIVCADERSLGICGVGCQVIDNGMITQICVG